MTNKLNFTGWSGGTFDLSKLNISDSPRGVSKNYTTNLNGGKMSLNLSVNYTYTYLIQACAQPLMDETITYIVGSDTELISGGTITYSFQSLENPSITVCGFVLDEPFSGTPEYVMVNTYVDCEEAYTSNYKMVVFEECLNYINETPIWFVDNKYEIGDVFYLDTVIDYSGRTFAKFAGTILDILPWSGETPYLDVWNYIQPVNYLPYSSCEEAIETNGLIYVAISCSEMEINFPLIHTRYDNTTTILIPTGNNPVKFLVDYLPTGDYGVISGGTPEIYSTIKIADGEDCVSGLSKTSPQGLLNYNFDNTGFDGDLVYTTVEQPDGKILVGGNFTQYLEVNVGNFMRLNSDGSLDETFYLGQFNSYVRAIALQPDGKILVGGNFTNYDGYNAGRIIRLNSDGTIDSGFTYNSEFDNKVRAIAIQKDGKIVVGGDFNHYYNFYCPNIVRLNSNGTPDSTFVMGEGFDGNSVFTITIESIRNTPFYSTNGPVTYTENILVGGWFIWYNGTTVRGIVKLSPTGEVLPDFGQGFNVNEGNSPRVNQILTQPDGKIVVIGGGVGEGYLYDYNETWIPENIVRLVKINGIYQIDSTFTTSNWNDGGGFHGISNDAALSISLLPNGKYMVGGQFNEYGDNNNNHIDLPYLVRLNSDGTLDETFTFEITDNYVNKVLLLSSGILLVGGWFQSPMDLLLELFIGDDYVLRSFDTCDGNTSNIFVPTDYEIQYQGGALESVTELSYSPISTSGLDLVYDVDIDDENFVFVLPTPFDVSFLGVNYTSINISSNSFIVFGEAGNTYESSPCCFEIPNEIPTLGYGDDDIVANLPGVFISTNCGGDNILDGLDNQLYYIYTGLTDGDNTMIVRYEGTYHCNESINPDLIYNFKFYKDNSNYFDLIIEQNTKFFNNDPTGGVSDGINPTWVSSFNSSSERAYRFTTNLAKPIKANVNDRVAVCGTVGDIITTPNLNVGTGFTLFTLTNTTSYNTCDDCGQIYKSILYVRDGRPNLGSVKQFLLTPNSISDINTKGPIFTLRGTECYELLKYYY